MKSGCGVNESHPLWLKHGRNPSMIDELNDDQWISLIMEWKARALMNELSSSE